MHNADLHTYHTTWLFTPLYAPGVVGRCCQSLSDTCCGLHVQHRASWWKFVLILGHLVFCGLLRRVASLVLHLCLMPRLYVCHAGGLCVALPVKHVARVPLVLQANQAMHVVALFVDCFCPLTHC